MTENSSPVARNSDPVAHNRGAWDREVAGPVEFSHSLTGQIGGQLAAGFVLTHLTEAPHHNGLTAAYLPGYIATRAVRRSG